MWSLAVRRARAHVWLLAAFALTSMSTTFVLCGLATSSARDADSEVARALSAPPARDGALRISATTRLPEEVAESEELARRATALGLVVTPSVRTEVLGDGGRRYVAVSDPTVPERATLSSGRWGDGDGEATVPEAAARRLGVTPGDRLTLGTTTVSVVGTWTADQPGDPRWFGDPAVGSGSDAGAVGPVVVTARTLAALPESSTSSWVLTTPSGAGRAELADWATEVPALVMDANEGAVDVAGALGRRVEDVARADASVAATRTVCLVLVAVLNAVATWFVAGALRRARGRETAVLRARGGSRPQLLLWYGADALAAGAAGVLLGVVGAAALIGAPGWTAIAASAALVTVVAAMRAWPTSGSSASGHQQPGTSRADAAPVTVVGVVLVAAAVLSALRVSWASDIVVVDGAGRVTTDLVGVLAPALVLVAAGLVFVALARPLLGSSARLAARTSTRLAGVLSLRLAARRARAQAAATMLVTLVVGCVLTAAAGSASTSDLVARTHEAAVGADVRVTFDVAPLVDGQSPAVDLTPYADLPGVTSVQPAVSTDVGVADVTTTLLAVAAPLGPDGEDANDPVPAGPVPVAVTTRLADLIDLRPGDEVEVLVQVAAARFQGVVSRVADHLPGLPGDSGMVADLRIVEDRLSDREVPLAVNTLLLESRDPPRSAEAVTTVVERPYAVTTAQATDDGTVGSAGPWVWVVLTAVVVGGCGLAAVVVGGARRGRREAAVLQALGATSSERLRALLGEVALAVVLGAAAGVVGAGVVAMTVLPSLGHALLAGGSPDVGFTLAVDGAVLGWASVGVAAVVVLLGLASARVLRSADLEALREEAA